MIIKVENLGMLRQAEFEIGNFTIICGKNNTGKTYATYALYGFIDFWRKRFRLTVDPKAVDALLEKGTVVFHLASFVELITEELDRASKEYVKYLPSVFASKRRNFENTTFSVRLQSNKSMNKYSPMDRTIVFGAEERIKLQFTATSEYELKISLLAEEKAKDQLPPLGILSEAISDTIKDIVYQGIIPNTFVSSAERTGTAIFQKELDFNKNKLVELLKDEKSKFHPLLILNKFTSDYALPVRDNVNFIRELESISNWESFISKSNPEILALFSDIIGGEYKIVKNVGVCFVPNYNRRLQLTLNESSSAVRSLLDIGFYLRHIARPGDMLMVDEPELNLHPENQRLLARIFARLIKLGIKVFITTHSDYIIKELNTLIMLNSNEQYIQSIKSEEGYKDEELLKVEDFRVYIADYQKLLIPPNKRKVSVPTLLRADINAEFGIELPSFDKAIDEMNRIQESLYFAKEGGK